MKRMIPKSGNRFSEKIMRNDIVPLREPLAAIMHDAGDLARATARGPFKRWTKGDDNSPVTEADIAVNDLLRTRLTALMPAAAWLSEETEELPDRALPLAWVVDPIDGTRAYIAGRADWTVSVALVEDGRPQLAALYAPVSDEMFLALHGRGATLNGATIAVSRGETLSGARARRPETLSRQARRARPQHLGAAAGALARLAARPRRARGPRRRLRFARQPGLGPRGGRPVLHEAGGSFTDFSGQPLRYKAPLRNAWRADCGGFRPPRHANRPGAQPPRRVCINDARVA